jgi:hypothetical protein
MDEAEIKGEIILGQHPYPLDKRRLQAEPGSSLTLEIAAYALNTGVKRNEGLQVWT